MNQAQLTKTPGNSRAIRVGFVPLNDCAPIVIAQERGFFERYGLNVTLHRELGWATIRDKIIYGELDAAHALASMPLVATLGLGSIRCDCLTGVVLNLNGNAITLSEGLWRRGVTDARALGTEILRLRHEKIFTFGVVHRFSSHQHLLRKWLMKNGINPERDVRIVVVPPSQMVANLASGNLDGFCVGEPWNSVAIHQNAGWCVETSGGIDPSHPEKVLLVRRDFAERHVEKHVALIAALLDACEFCDQPEHATTIAETLSRPEYVDAPAEALLRASEEFRFGHGLFRAVPDFCLFHRDGANAPSSSTAAWALDLVRNSGACNEPSALNHVLGRRVYRMDIFEQAMQLRSAKRIANEHEDESELTVA
jgi:ABC-type nitrate/sulfonate/bicarbonate transport system substrate-binding protein